MEAARVLTCLYPTRRPVRRLDLNLMLMALIIRFPSIDIAVIQLVGIIIIIIIIIINLSYPQIYREFFRAT